MSNKPSRRSRSAGGASKANPPRQQAPRPPTRTASSRASAGPARGDQRSGARAALERHSVRPLMVLHSLPRWVVPVLLGSMLLLGLILQGPLAWVGGILLAIVSVLVIWLTALSWPVLTPGSRMMRFVIGLMLVGITILKFMNRF